jgi:hypothetical protein
MNMKFLIENLGQFKKNNAYHFLILNSDLLKIALN